MTVTDPSAPRALDVSALDAALVRLTGNDAVLRISDSEATRRASKWTWK